MAFFAACPLQPFIGNFAKKRPMTNRMKLTVSLLSLVMSVGVLAGSAQAQTDAGRIYLGSPWENGYNERFNSTLRHEVLNWEWPTSIKQAQTAINMWLKEYNHIQPPVPETLN
ncbi:MAG: integrase core domain-containing protein [Litorimonas sp.]